MNRADTSLRDWAIKVWLKEQQKGQIVLQDCRFQNEFDGKCCAFSHSLVTNQVVAGFEMLL